MREIVALRPLIRLGLWPIHLLPQGEKGGTHAAPRLPVDDEARKPAPLAPVLAPACGGEVAPRSGDGEGAPGAARRFATPMAPPPRLRHPMAKPERCEGEDHGIHAGTLRPRETAGEGHLFFTVAHFPAVLA